MALIGSLMDSASGGVGGLSTRAFIMAVTHWEISTAKRRRRVKQTTLETDGDVGGTKSTEEEKFSVENLHRK